MKINLRYVSGSTQFFVFPFVLALAAITVPGQARADLMDQALENYSKSKNDYYKGMKTAKTPEQQAKLKTDTLQPAYDGITRAFQEQSRITLDNAGISVNGSRAPRGGAQVSTKMALKDVEGFFGVASSSQSPQVVPQRGLASSPSGSSVTTQQVSNPLPGNSQRRTREVAQPSSVEEESVIVNGDQKIEQTVYPSSGSSGSGSGSGY